MKIPEGDTKIVYYKYNRRGEAKVVPRHLVHPKVFATLVGVLRGGGCKCGFIIFYLVYVGYCVFIFYLEDYTFCLFYHIISLYFFLQDYTYCSLSL